MTTLKMYEAIGITVPVHTFDAILSRCESPIETALAREVLERCSPFMRVHTQYQVDTDDGLFRLDIAVIGPLGKLAVECDGHDFHEKTKEQAQRDKLRDRALTRAGWRIVRFTGSEIHRNLSRCGGEISGLAFTFCIEEFPG